jgi:hypothetical protein
MGLRGGIVQGRVLLLCLTCLFSGLQVVPARADSRVVAVDPQVQEGRLQCRLRTEGLPGDKQLQSMQSGLEAAVELHLALQDDGDGALASKKIVLRLAFDLWDQVYSVRGAGPERRFAELADLRAFLADLQGLDLCSTGLLEADARYRLQVAMVVHAVAPDEQARVEQVITGSGSGGGQDQDRQEASVSLGRLIRVFYKGGGGGRNDQELISDWFAGKEVRP